MTRLRAGVVRFENAACDLRSNLFALMISSSDLCFFFIFFATASKHRSQNQSPAWFATCVLGGYEADRAQWVVVRPSHVLLYLFYVKTRFCNFRARDFQQRMYVWFLV